MASFEEIRHRVEQRLEELFEESTRLRAALEALGGDGAPASRGLPVVKTVSRDRLVKPRRGSAVTPVEPEAVSSDDATRDSPVERAVRQVRQELAAGLRTGRTGGRDVVGGSRLGRRTAPSVPAQGGCG